jgi:fructokinase
MSTFITCMGECLIDFLPVKQPEEEASSDFRMHPAGSILNVAVGLARLGQKTTFSCKIADDSFGRILRAYITAEKIDTRFLIPVSGGRSTLAFVAMEGGNPVFNFYGEGAADTLLTIDDISETLFAETHILHFGSISLLQGTTPEAILQTAERLKGKALLSFDPNLRPELVHDEPGYRKRLQRALALADVVKLSDVDLSWMMPGLSPEQALHELLTQGPALVVITQGAKGVIGARVGGSAVKIPTFSVDIADTVGAGDAFCAGLLTQLVERGITTRENLQHISKDELSDLLRFAAGVAALNCMRSGANPPQRIEVDQFLQQQPKTSNI